jgi:protein TonB
MDGEEAPYVFVLLEPEKTTPESEIPRFRKGMGITEPVIKHRIQPKYPKEALRDRASGQVVLEATIDTEGRVQAITVLADPDPRLSQAAVEALKQWVFEPARREDGTAVMVRTAVTIRFHLR